MQWIIFPLPLFRGICSGRVPLVIDNMPSPQSGIWYALEVKCSIPLEIAAHKTASVKGDRYLDSVLSAFILNTEGILIQVGSRKFIVTRL